MVKVVVKLDTAPASELDSVAKALTITRRAPVSVKNIEVSIDERRVIMKLTLEGSSDSIDWLLKKFLIMPETSGVEVLPT